MTNLNFKNQSIDQNVKAICKTEVPGFKDIQLLFHQLENKDKTFNTVVYILLNLKDLMNWS